MGWLRDRRVLVALVVAYVVALVAIVVAPWGWALNRFTVALYVFFRSSVPIAPTGALPEDYGVILNVLLFAPLGALGVLVTGRRWWWVTLVGALGSVSIELAQRQWLGREASVVDVVANTLGALLGAVAVSLLARRESPRAGRPGSPRRR